MDPVVVVGSGRPCPMGPASPPGCGPRFPPCIAAAELQAAKAVLSGSCQPHQAAESFRDEGDQEQASILTSP